MCDATIVFRFDAAALIKFLRVSPIVLRALVIKFVQPVAAVEHVAKNPSNVASSVHLE